MRRGWCCFANFLLLRLQPDVAHEAACCCMRLVRVWMLLPIRSPQVGLEEMSAGGAHLAALVV